jgi:hypothetical protein
MTAAEQVLAEYQRQAAYDGCARLLGCLLALAAVAAIVGLIIYATTAAQRDRGARQDMAPPPPQAPAPF